MLILIRCDGPKCSSPFHFVRSSWRPVLLCSTSLTHRACFFSFPRKPITPAVRRRLLPAGCYRPAPHRLLRRLLVAVDRILDEDSLPPNISSQKTSNAYSILTA